MGECINCKWFDYLSRNKEGDSYGYCDRLNDDTFIEIETQYPELIDGVRFSVMGDFGCALWTGMEQ